MLCKKKIRKILALSTAFSILFCNTTFATEISLDNSTKNVSTDTLTKTEGTDYFTNEVTNEWNNGRISENVKVTINISSDFEITIPKEIVLSGENKSAKYTVNVKGDIAGDQVLEVRPDDEFAMTDETSKEDVLMTVTQDDIYFFYDDLLGDGTNYEGEISGPISAGEWSGKFYFNINYFKNLFVDINPTITYTTTSSNTQTTKEFESYNELKKFTVGNTNLKEVVLYNREQQLPNKAKTKVLTLSDENTIAEKPTSFSGYFKGCTNLTKLDLRNFVIEDTLDVAEMIGSCDNLSDNNIVGLNVPKATNITCIREHDFEITETTALTQYKCKHCSHYMEYKNYSYLGNSEEVTLEPGTYKLEVWGAQGGNGGKGGYSYGNIKLEETTTLYVCVGGAGVYNTAYRSDYGSVKAVSPGGYNGGGQGGSYYSISNNISGTDPITKIYCGSGGGATHIALSSGVLASLYEKQEDILIVAGGGGGYGSYWSRDRYQDFNSYSAKAVGTGGGGNNPGTDGKITSNPGLWSESNHTAKGGGLTPEQSLFGQGAGVSSSSYGVGAGGGYMGGSTANYAAGGGSGYLSSVLTEAGGTTGIRPGNGSVRITKIS